MTLVAQRTDKREGEDHVRLRSVEVVVGVEASDLEKGSSRGGVAVIRGG